MERSFHAMIMPQTGTQSIDRAAQLLVHVVETADAPTVGELSDRTGLPKSTTSRLVGALERQGLIHREHGSGQLRPGAVLVRFARRETGEAELVELARDALDRLAAASGETVNLGVPWAGAVELLDQRDARHFLGSTNWVGRTVPPHGSALGKVFFAFGALPLPDGPLDHLAPRTIVERSALVEDLERVRDIGYAIAVEELEPGLWAVAAPVRDDDAVIAALSISGPTLRLHDEQLDELAQLTRREADEVSTRLGYDNRKRGAA